jgi:predicted O-linked N-acetylglucosamine transferase (SPINDLY family)
MNADEYTYTGITFYQQGRLDEAIEYFRKAIQLDPNSPEAYHYLGIALQSKKHLNEAATCYQKSLQLDPGYADAHLHFGNLYRVIGRLDEAVLHFRDALRLQPDSAAAYNILGLTVQDQGKLEEAEKYFRHALHLQPDFSGCHSNLLFLLNYNSRYHADVIFEEHLNFAQRFERPLLSATSYPMNDKSTDRRLRVGYLSPDFRRHSVAFFIESILTAHNRSEFEVVCYSDVMAPDHVTERIHARIDQWRNITGMLDQDVAALIRRDEVDILVDLAGHTGYNRMLVFARRPAPIQVTWIGYPATTGLTSMDYKIVDRFTDPPGMSERHYTEKLMRMPECFLCYLPETESPAVGSLPMLSSQYVTFGSFNNFKKMSPEVFRMWAEILKAVPQARMVLKANSFSDPTTCQAIKDIFVREGVAEQRIELLPLIPNLLHHLEVYNYIDIALDTFPYNGTTTTCEALYMGVPVITLAGDTHASRVGASLLSNVGVPELIACSSDDYVEIAVGLAHDRDRLDRYRRNLRAKMKDSPLTDAERFTVALEHSFRQMWQVWCESS